MTSTHHPSGTVRTCAFVYAVLYRTADGTPRSLYAALDTPVTPITNDPQLALIARRLSARFNAEVTVVAYGITTSASAAAHAESFTDADDATAGGAR
jgi:hypothetical protein